MPADDQAFGRHVADERVAASITSEKPTSVHLIGAATTDTGDTTTITLTYEYELPQTWAVARVTFDRRGGLREVDDVQLAAERDSQAHLNAVTLRGKSAPHYIVGALTILVPIFTMATLAALLDSARPRKLLWLLFVAFGVGQLTFNWTTGAWSADLWQVQVLGAGFVKTGSGPLLLAVSFPLGAIVFWLTRKA